MSQRNEKLEKNLEMMKIKIIAIWYTIRGPSLGLSDPSDLTLVGKHLELRESSI